MIKDDFKISELINDYLFVYENFEKINRAIYYQTMCILSNMEFIDHELTCKSH